MKNILYVKDGDNISVIVKLGPSVTDPIGAVEGIAQMYRVVANFMGLNSAGTVLQLVPLSNNPVSIARLPEDANTIE